MSRFANNARNGGEHKVVGPLTTEETSRQAKLLVKKVQQRNESIQGRSTTVELKNKRRRYLRVPG